MFNRIFQGNVKNRKHPGRCAFAESKPIILPLGHTLNLGGPKQTRLQTLC